MNLKNLTSQSKNNGRKNGRARNLNIIAKEYCTQANGSEELWKDQDVLRTYQKGILNLQPFKNQF